MSFLEERWVNRFEPRKTRQPVQWKQSSWPAPKKAKVVLYVGKVMAPVVEDVKVTMFTNIL